LTAELKKEMLRLLKEDIEFRYTVAGLIGLDEILKRLDRNEAELVRLREDMLNGFKRHDEALERHSKIIEKHTIEIARLREDMLEGFKRHDELFLEVFKRFEDLGRKIDALGARWGLMAEEAFRGGLKGLLEKELKLTVERWESYDDEGLVYGYPSLVEVDLTLHNEKITLIEVTSHVRASDVYTLKRKSILYEKKTGKRPSRLMIVTPYSDEGAIEASKELGIEVYTKV